MSDQMQITIDQDTYDRLSLLMVPPINDANGAIRSLLEYGGHPTPAAIALGAAHHFTMAEELERSRMGVYEGGGNT